MNNIKELKQICKDLRVLYVEDDSKLGSIVYAYLAKIFSRVDMATDGKDGLDKYKNNFYDIVITDILMPKLDGLGMSQEIKKINKNQKILVLSACLDTQGFVKSIEIGVDGYILKPFRHEQLNEIIYKIANSINESRENEIYKTKLMQLVDIKIKEASRLEKEKAENYKDMLYTLVGLIEQRDAYTGDHSKRVEQYCKLIALEMNMDKKSLKDLLEAAMLHDIGKVAIPDSILLKPGKLNEIEYKLIQQHVKLGYKILNNSPLFKTIAQIVKVHHERIDGSGYPDGLKGDEISLGGKIIGVADSFDAMTTSRIYKPRKTIKAALEEIESLSGIRFDKQVVAATLKALKDVQIKEDISQEPSSEIEKERFSYFYRDHLTHLFNENYLDLILNKNVFQNLYQELYVVFLKDFHKYNKEHGWLDGDILLKGVADILKKNHKNSLIFRIHGDDFVILGPKGMIFEDVYEFCEKNSLVCYHSIVDLHEKNITSMKSLEDFIGP